MKPVRDVLRPLAFALIVGSVALPAVVASAPASASEIKYVVNNQAVTNYDIQRRAAFLRLQNKRGNLQQMAADDMIDQALRTSEMKRLGINITDDQVSDAYERFAKSNNLTAAQMDQVMNQSGITKAHFREFIRTQIGWNRAMSSRSRSSEMSEQDVAQRMLQQGGDKPSATEYMLQQVIFVVPAGERGAKLGARKREAEALKQRFRSCDNTREFVKGLLDVTVRDLGRVLAPELPPEWAESVKAAKPGSATNVRETDRGVEFIGICSAREVSDDRVAQMVFETENQGSGASEDLSKKYTDELREKAQIVNR